MDDLDLPAVPDPAAVPSLPTQTVAYTDLDRRETIASADGVTVHEVRVDGVGAALAEVEGRRGPTGRALTEAADDWRATADVAVAATLSAAGKKPRSWVVAERPPLPLGSTPTGLDVPLPTAQAVWTVATLADGFATAHDRDVVHGAPTPATVRCWPGPDPGTWELPRVVDWGLAGRRLETSAAGDGDRPGGIGVVGARSGSVSSVPDGSDFLAPEAGSEAAGPPADVYGLGALAYWLLTGAVPYDGTPTGTASAVPPSTLVPTLPDAVDGIVLSAVAVDPAARPSAAALRDGLTRVLRDSGVTGDSSGAESGSNADDVPDVPSAFPLFDGSRADWRAACPTCGRSVNNTVTSFVDHWVDARRCDGPPSRPPSSVTGLTDSEYATVVTVVERLRRQRDDDAGGIGDHPLVAALADDGVVVSAVGGVSVRRPDGTFPWLDRPGRGWRVPCPACSDAVFNALPAFRSHWAEDSDCEGPPDDFETR